MFTFNHCKHINYVNDHPALGKNTSYIPEYATCKCKLVFSLHMCAQCVGDEKCDKGITHVHSVFTVRKI